MANLSFLSTQLPQSPKNMGDRLEGIQFLEKSHPTHFHSWTNTKKLSALHTGFKKDLHNIVSIFRFQMAILHTLLQYLVRKFVQI